MPNYSEAEMRRLAAMLGNPKIAQASQGVMTNQDADRIMQNLGNTQTTNILPIPMNENNMPMFATDTEYLNYLQEYDPEMFMQMQNEFYNTRGTMGQGSPLKGLLDRIMGGN